MKKATIKLIEKAREVINDPNALTSTRQDIANQLQAAIEDDDDKKPWWVIVLKVLAYAIGLLLAGYGTTAAAATLWHSYLM